MAIVTVGIDRAKNVFALHGQLPGVGETTATAIVSTVGNGHDFACGRQFCAAC